MGFYQEHIVPHLVNLAMRNRELSPYRERVLAAAEGRVLEIGIGAGPNLRFSSAEAIPLEGGSVDTVVTTWTLCSIADASQALSEMRRVLKPSGQLLFVEHGQAPEESVRKWQDRLTPVWKRIAGGCHLNRPIPALLEGAGFHITHLATGYMKGPKPMTFLYEGSALRD